MESGANLRFAHLSRLALCGAVVLCAVAVVPSAHGAELESTMRDGRFTGAHLTETKRPMTRSLGRAAERFCARHAAGLHAFFKARAEMTSPFWTRQDRREHIGEMVKAARARAAAANRALEDMRDFEQSGSSKPLTSLMTMLRHIAKGAHDDLEHHDGLFADKYAKAMRAGVRLVRSSDSINLNNLIVAAFDPAFLDSASSLPCLEATHLHMSFPTHAPLAELHGVSDASEARAPRDDYDAGYMALLRRHLLNDSTIRETVARNVARRMALLTLAARGEVFEPGSEPRPVRRSAVRVRAGQLGYAVRAVVDWGVHGAEALEAAHRILMQVPDDAEQGLGEIAKASEVLRATGYTRD